MKSLHGKSKNDGHIAVTNYGDDGKIHFTALRKRGQKIVTVGEYWIDAKDLAEFCTGAGERVDQERGESDVKRNG